MPKISIVLPIHDMKNGAFFFWRAINSIMEQTLKDYEIVIVKEGLMAENTNAGIRRAKGEYIKILYMDDYLAHPNALADIVQSFQLEGEWLITAADTNLKPQWMNDIQYGNNKLGSPSALTFRNYFQENQLFDENLSWLLDCDLYRRLYDRHGPPIILETVNVNIGVGEHQVTHLMSDEDKLKEHEYINKKWQPEFY